MTYTVELTEDKTYVRVVFADAMVREEHEQGRDEAIRALADNGWDRLLVDARRIDAKMSVLDDFEFTQENRSTLLQSVRIAVIHRVDETGRFRFIEDVAVNRGVKMRVFSNPEEAIDWFVAK